MVNNSCYPACGTNAYVNNNICTCLPGFQIGGKGKNQCILAKPCLKNEVYDGKKCVCIPGYTKLKGACQLVSKCPVGLVWNATLLSCICPQPDIQYISNGTCITCQSNSYSNGTACNCNTGYFFVSGICTTCP